MHALSAIHEALVPGGLLVDTQPVSAAPDVGTADGLRAVLDMREWSGVVEAVDRLVGEVIDAGLFTLVEERRFVVEDSFADGAELMTASADWRGCRVDEELARRLSTDSSASWLRQEVRLRVLRSTGWRAREPVAQRHRGALRAPVDAHVVDHLPGDA